MRALQRIQSLKMSINMKVKHIEVDKVSISEELVACIGYFD